MRILKYLGVRAATPPNFKARSRAPLTTDVDAFIGDLWLQETTEHIWMLTVKSAGVATWTALLGGGISGITSIIAGGNVVVTNPDGPAVTVALSDEITLTTVNAGTFATTDAAAGLTITGSTISAYGTDDDINVTISGQGAGKVIIDDLQITDDLSVASGGTGVSLLADNCILVGSGTDPITAIAVGTAGQVLTSNGVDVDPSWQAGGGGAGGASSFVTGDGTAVDDEGVINILGGTNLSTSGAGNTVTIDIESSATAGQFLASGGTGVDTAWTTSTFPTTTTQGDVLYAPSDNTVSSLAKNTVDSRYLANTGASNNPEWSQIDLITGVTGILPVSNGGTGGFNFDSGTLLVGDGMGSIDTINSGAIGTVLQGLDGSAPIWSDTTYPSDSSKGDLIVATNDNEFDKLAAGPTGYVLTSNGEYDVPTWEYPSGGGDEGSKGSSGGSVIAWNPARATFSSNSTCSDVNYGADGYFCACSDYGGISVTNTPTGKWSRPSSIPFIGYVNGINYGDGYWVAVGASVKIAYTTTPTGTWTAGTHTITKDLNKVAYGNGLWVAVGGYDIISTTDPTGTWSAVTHPAGGASDVHYANGLWVTVGDEITTSTDGITWTARTSPLTDSILRVRYGGGYWVTSGQNGEIATSTDGITWTANTDTPFASTHALAALTYGEGVWFASNWMKQSNGTATNPSGTWKQGLMVYDHHTSYAHGSYAAAYGSGYFVAVGYLNKVAVGQLIGAGTSESSIEVAASSFIDKTILGIKDLVSIIYGNGIWVIVSSGGKFLTSTDIKGDWAEQSYGSPKNIGSSAYGNGYYVFTGAHGEMYTTDLTSWTIGSSTCHNKIIFADGLFVAVGANGTVYYTADPSSGWTSSPITDANYTMSDTTYGNGYWVTTGTKSSGPYDSKIWYSTNLSNPWNECHSSTGVSLATIEYANSMFLAAGGGGTYDDGIHYVAETTPLSWTEYTTTGTNISYYATVANGLFVLSDGKSRISLTSDPTKEMFHTRTFSNVTGSNNYKLAYGGGYIAGIGYYCNSLIYTPYTS